MSIWKKLFGGGSKPPTTATAKPQQASGEEKRLNEAERKSIYSEFHKFLNTHGMMEAASCGLGEEAGVEYALTKASEHIERAYSLNFEQWLIIFKQGQQKNWNKWP